MKLKTSITIISGCLFLFIFLMLPVFLNIKEQKDDMVASFKGSEFSLKDVNDKTITEKSFDGPLTAIFFEKEKFKVFFVSIDPTRDTPDIIKNYLDGFENKIFGITGDPKKVFLLSQSWGVLSEKIFTEDGNYLINHSSSVLLLKNGKYLDRISHHAAYKEMFKKIDKLLR